MAKIRDPTYGGGRGAGKKDPNAPKRPLSAYMLWLAANRDRLKNAAKEPKSVAEVVKQAGVEWKQLAAKDKQEWQKKAVTAKGKYEAELKAYQAKGKAKK